MDLEKIKQQLHEKVEDLERTRQAQSFYIQQQFNTSKSKGQQDRQKITAKITDLEQHKLSTLCFILAIITPIIMMRQSISVYVAMIVCVCLIICGAIAHNMSSGNKSKSLNDK